MSITTGCANSGHVVAVDEEWALHRGKAACEQQIQMGHHCDYSDVDAEVRDFELRLATAVESFPVCAGVIIETGPKAQRPLKVDTSSLAVDFVPGQSEQSWNIARNSKSLGGKASPEETARQVCGIVRGLGGTAR